MAVKTRGRLHAQAAEFDAALAVRQQAAADQMLAAWTTSYKNVRTELDKLAAKITAAREAGEELSPAWLYQKGRLKALLDTAKVEVNRYAQDASKAAVAAQSAAVRAAEVHAEKLTKTVLSEDLGITGTFTRTDPTALIRQAVGFTGDGTVLSEHLAKTLTPEAVDGIRATLVKGLALGKGQDWLVREVTRNFAVVQSRAATIMRTETMRVYREVSRTTYAANANVLEGWTWQAHLDAVTCIACAMMDGTLHDVEETLDGHPNCRCAMLPRTKSWEDLGVPGLADTRPDIPSGQAWVEAQPAATQRALMGPAKFDAWKRGEIELSDMVGQHHSDDWGSMRTERSLKAIQENRNANSAVSYVADGTPPLPPSATPAPVLPDPLPPAPSAPLTVPDVPATPATPVAPALPATEDGLRAIIRDPSTTYDEKRAAQKALKDLRDKAASEAAAAVQAAKDAAAADAANLALPGPKYVEPPLPTSTKFQPQVLEDYRIKLRTMDDDTLDAQLDQKDKAVRELVRNEIDRRAFYDANPFSGTDPYKLPSHYKPEQLDVIRDAASIFSDDDLVKALAERTSGPLVDDAAAEIIRREQQFRRSLVHASTDDLRRLLAEIPDDSRNVTYLSHRQALEKAIDSRTFDPPWPKLAEPELPEVAVKGTNPNWKTEPDGRWNKNCTNCTTAYELRRQGFDVLAQARVRGRSSYEINQLWGINDAEKGTALQFKKAIESGMPEGSRGYIACDWAGGGGHIFNWEVKDGALQLWDSQPGTAKDFREWKARLRSGSHVTWARLDNRPLLSTLNDFLLDYSQPVLHK